LCLFSFHLSRIVKPESFTHSDRRVETKIEATTYPQNMPKKSHTVYELIVL